ncbi:hypothetical protein F7734_57655 [Scytonema sp. UIC 10036]|uniref:hypothetical protein n=1 Tax=Scytonema sp. UIC 10036 TaxID=2304196 RepID=UPI0012DAD4CA|nr:hypothetical protein [Scytonema sp. UIC 10036]MUH01393.1 hypothetical protein [Scytonema sp. UIC 10036]
MRINLFPIASKSITSGEYNLIKIIQKYQEQFYVLLWLQNRSDLGFDSGVASFIALFKEPNSICLFTGAVSDMVTMPSPPKYADEGGGYDAIVKFINSLESVKKRTLRIDPEDVLDGATIRTQDLWEELCTQSEDYRTVTQRMAAYEELILEISTNKSGMLFLEETFLNEEE